MSVAKLYHVILKGAFHYFAFSSLSISCFILTPLHLFVFFPRSFEPCHHHASPCLSSFFYVLIDTGGKLDAHSYLGVPTSRKLAFCLLNTRQTPAFILFRFPEEIYYLAHLYLSCRVIITFAQVDFP